MDSIVLLDYIANLGRETSELRAVLARFLAKRHLENTQVWRVREAKNNLGTVLKLARAGKMQIIQNSRSPAEPVVVISVRDLKDIIKTARRLDPLRCKSRSCRSASVE